MTSCLGAQTDCKLPRFKAFSSKPASGGSLHGKGVGDPTEVTAGNFLRSVPFVLVLTLLMVDSVSLNRAGLGYATLSGALTSGLGYAIWYKVLPALRATSAATVQLSVPVITAVSGVLFLGESITLRLILASTAILGGIALTILVKTTANEVPEDPLKGITESN
jgi:drug/metabolite transporter (DMT)-like permease